MKTCAKEHRDCHSASWRIAMTGKGEACAKELRDFHSAIAYAFVAISNDNSQYSRFRKNAGSSVTDLALTKGVS